jgi:hypothetical protein
LNVHGGFSNAPFWSGDVGLQDRYVNQYNENARMALTVDTRTATEYGVVQDPLSADNVQNLSHFRE